MNYIRTELSDYASITPEDVRAAAAKWFKPETAWRLKVVPGPGVR
jgi:zinc protease